MVAYRGRVHNAEEEFKKMSRMFPIRGWVLGVCSGLAMSPCRFVTSPSVILEIQRGGRDVESSQYATDGNLAKRVAIHCYNVSSKTFFEWYDERLSIATGSCVLDIGCGNGNCWLGKELSVDQSTKVYLVNNSQGMLDAARSKLNVEIGNWHFDLADVQDIPYESGFFNVPLANHMLYYAESINRAVSEIARVLMPSGVLHASTNGSGHMSQLSQWMAEVGPATIITGMGQYAKKFGLENGEDILSKHFADVSLDLYESFLSVPAAEPVTEYVLSMQPPDTAKTREALDTLRGILEFALMTKDEIRIDKHSGLFTARQL